MRKQNLQNVKIKIFFVCKIYGIYAAKCNEI